VTEIYDFITRETEQQNIHLMIESSIYFVAKHYGISIPDVLSMSIDDFEQSFVWASAMKTIEGEQIESATKDVKGGTRIQTTKAGQAFPYE